MIKLIIFILSIFILSHCSFNEKTTIWKDKEIQKEIQKDIIKISSKNKKIVAEFNDELKLDLSKIKMNNKIVDNKNDYGSQDYTGEIIKVGRYKFSKLENVKQLNFKPIFFNNGLIFFDKKGSIIRYKENQKILWKMNHYSKSERKLKPKLNFVLEGKNLIVTDSIAKYYSVNVNTGTLNWSKSNIYPFNSGIKKSKNKFFVVDYKNTLRCYNINDGSECWNLQTEDSFTLSNSNFSLIIVDDLVVFNNSVGDITAVNIETGLITWQLPTQNSSIINQTYTFKASKLVSDGKSIFFSNNKNEFYSVDVKTGTTNWINEINSNLTPIISENLLFTVSNEGYLYTLEKNGNIIRITDLFLDYKIKKRENVKPIGFAMGNTKLYLTNTDGKMLVVDLNLGKVISIEKVARNLTSRPFISNKNLFVITNGSIIQYN